MIKVLAVDGQVICPQLPWCPMLWLWWLWPLCPGLPPQNSSIRSTCHHGRSCLRHHYNHKQRDRSHSYSDSRHRRWYSRSWSCPILAATEVAVLEGTPHALLPATAATPATLQLMDAPITPHAIAASYPALTTYATLWTRAGLTPATPATQHKDTNAGKSSNVQDPQPPKTPPPQNCYHPGFSFRLFIRFLQWHWYFKLLEPSPSSDEDEWGGNSFKSLWYKTISDCPTVTVHMGERFKALIDSGVALSLVCTSMIEDCCKTGF